MIAFIQIAYCCSIPLLLFFSLRFVTGKWALISHQLIATSNILLLLLSAFLVKQSMGLYHLAKQTTFFQHNASHNVIDLIDGFFIRQLIIILLPLLFLFKKWRGNKILTLCMLLLMYWNNPVSVWNNYDLLFKVLAYLSLLTAAFALLWMSNQFTVQSDSE